MKINPAILGYSFDIKTGPHVLEDSNGWTIFLILDSSLDVEFCAAYNEELGHVVISDYGEYVNYIDKETYREFIREYKEHIQ